jgi:hypothetical protein
MKTIYLFVLIICTNIFGQSPEPSSFFPASVGNIWEYNYTGYGIAKYEIVKDSILSDKSRLIFYSMNSNAVYKVDTSNNVYYDPQGMNWLYYKLDADSGVSWFNIHNDTSANKLMSRVNRIFSAVLFGKTRTVKEISNYALANDDTTISEFSWLRETDYLVSGIGLYATVEGEGGGTELLLRGCVINNDTSGVITSVKGNPQNLLTYSLNQNYPNPFNPTTTITYSLNKPSRVKLIVYDILGRKITTLVDGIKYSGSYTVVFKGSNLPSGVYIYSLITDYGNQIKKMVLTK